MSETRKLRDKKQVPKTSKSYKRFQIGKELREQADSYTQQAQDEAVKAGKRRGASSLGGMLGGIGGSLALVALGPAAIGIGATMAAAGLGSLAGAKAGYEASIAKRGKRKDIKVDKFYKKEAADATQAVKDIDRQTRKKALVSAGTSAVLAGVGHAAKAGKFATGTKGAEGYKAFGKITNYGKELGEKLRPEFFGSKPLSVTKNIFSEGANIALSKSVSGAGSKASANLMAGVGAKWLTNIYGSGNVDTSFVYNPQEQNTDRV